MTSIYQTRTTPHGGAVVRGRESSSGDWTINDDAHQPHQCNSFVSSLSSTSELSSSSDDEPLEGAELLGLLGNINNAPPGRVAAGDVDENLDPDAPLRLRGGKGGRGRALGGVLLRRGSSSGECDGETAPTAVLTTTEEGEGIDRNGAVMPPYYHDADACEAATAEAATAHRWEGGCESASASYSSGTGGSTTLGGYETALSSLARCEQASRADSSRNDHRRIPRGGDPLCSPPFLPAAFASPPPPGGNFGGQGQQMLSPPPPPPPQESPSPFLGQSPSKGMGTMPSPAGSVCSSVESFVRKMAATPEQPKQQRSPAETSSGFPSPSSIGRRMRRLSVGAGHGGGDSPTRRSWNGRESPRRSGGNSERKLSGLSVPLPPRQQFCPPSRTSSLSRSCSVGSSISACSSIESRVVESERNPPLPPTTVTTSAGRKSGKKMVGIRRRFFGPAVNNRSKSCGGEEDATSVDEDSASASFHSIESTSLGGGGSFRLVPHARRRNVPQDRRCLLISRQRSIDDSVASSVGLGSVGSGLGEFSVDQLLPTREPERECRQLRRHEVDPFRSPPPVPRTIVSSSPPPPPNAPRPTPQMPAASSPSFDSSSHGHGGPATGGDQARLPLPRSSHRGRHRRVLSTAATPPRGGGGPAVIGAPGSSWAPPPQSNSSPSNHHHHRRIGSEPADVFSRLLRDQYGTSTLLGEDGDVDRKMARGACHRRGPSLSIGGSSGNSVHAPNRGVYCGMEEEDHHHPDGGGAAFPPPPQARMRRHHQHQQHPLKRGEQQRPQPRQQRQHPLLRHSAPSARLATTPPRINADNHHRSASAGAASLPPPVMPAASFSSAASGSTGPGKRRSTMEVCEGDEGQQPRLVPAASSFSSAASSDFFGDASCHKRSGSQLVARELRYIVGKFSPMPLLRGVSGGGSSGTNGGDVKLRRAKGCLT